MRLDSAVTAGGQVQNEKSKACLPSCILAISQDNMKNNLVRLQQMHLICNHSGSDQSACCEELGTEVSTLMAEFQNNLNIKTHVYKPYKVIMANLLVIFCLINYPHISILVFKPD